MKILLTGGTGFIGSHTALTLLEKGYELFILDSYVNSTSKSLDRVIRLVKQKSPNLSPKINIYEGDVRNKKLLEDIFSEAGKSGTGIDAVIHFAGLKAVRESIDKPLLYWDYNVSGSINLFKVMESFDVNTVIFSSSASVYRVSGNDSLKEDDLIKPINPYGATKAAIEKVLEDLFKSNKSKWRIANLRYFNPIGAHPSGLLGEDPLGLPNNLFPIINKVALGQIKELEVYGNDWETDDGTCIRDYIHVMDVSEGHVSALEYLLANKSMFVNLNLGTGKGTSVLELIKTFERVNEINIPYIYTPRRKGDSCSTVANNNLAIRLLNWTPKRNLEDMCRDGWNWYKLSQKN